MRFLSRWRASPRSACAGGVQRRRFRPPKAATARSPWASPRSAPRAAGAPPTPSRSRTRPRRPDIELKFSDAQQKQENQIKAIRSYIQQKVDVIAFSPGGRDRLGRGAERGQARQIPVILTDRAVDSEGHHALQDLPRLGLRQGGQEGRRVAGRSEYDATATAGQHRRAAGHHRLRPGDRPQEGLRGRRSRPIRTFKIIASQTGDFTRAAASRSWRRS